MTDLGTSASPQPSTGSPSRTVHIRAEEPTLEAVRAAIAQVLKLDVADVADVPDVPEGRRLFEDLGLDSTSALELLMEIETRTDAEFDLDTLEQSHFATVGSLAEYVQAQLDGAA